MAEKGVDSFVLGQILRGTEDLKILMVKKFRIVPPTPSIGTSGAYGAIVPSKASGTFMNLRRRFGEIWFIMKEVGSILWTPGSRYDQISDMEA